MMGPRETLQWAETFNANGQEIISEADKRQNNSFSEIKTLRIFTNVSGSSHDDEITQAGPVIE